MKVFIQLEKKAKQCMVWGFYSCVYVNEIFVGYDIVLIGKITVLV